MWRWLLVRIPLGLIGALVLAWVLLPWPVLLRWSEPASTSLMRDRVREARSGGEELRVRHEWAPLDRISPNLRRAVVAAEDGRFYRHGGVDWLALAEELRWEGEGSFSPFDGEDLRALGAAFRYYRDNRERVRGRSTITQQLAKNLYYTSDRSLPRKVQEFFVARRLEWFVGKDRILEVYLNVVEWGPGLFGAEAAAQHYFGRAAADLTLDQAASLAATLPHPLTSNPERNPGRMARRRSMILSWIQRSRDVPEREVRDLPRIPRPEELEIDLPEPELEDDPSPAERPPMDEPVEPPADEPVEPAPDDPDDPDDPPEPPEDESEDPPADDPVDPPTDGSGDSARAGAAASPGAPAPPAAPGT